MSMQHSSEQISYTLIESIHHLPGEAATTIVVALLNDIAPRGHMGRGTEQQRDEARTQTVVQVHFFVLMI